MYITKIRIQQQQKNANRNFSTVNWAKRNL